MTDDIVRLFELNWTIVIQLLFFIWLLYKMGNGKGLPELV